MSSYWMQTGVLFAGSYSEIPPAAFVLLTQFPAVASVFPPYSPAPISISPGLAPSNLQHVLGVTARLASFGISPSAHPLISQSSVGRCLRYGLYF
ncbi:hypothetical protein MHYP_G00200870 [Metynnis hypsauchen]